MVLELYYSTYLAVGVQTATGDLMYRQSNEQLEDAGLGSTQPP